MDTNIYVSALALPGGKADEALLGAVEGRYDLISSPALLAELANVLQSKFLWERERVIAACRDMGEIAIGVRPTERLSIFADEPDNRILECAVAGQADRMVTGDKHMLKVRRYLNVRIVTLADFIKDLIGL